MRYSLLVLVLVSGCAVSSAPCAVADAGPPPDALAPAPDAEQPSDAFGSCAAYYTAVTLRVSMVPRCAPNFRCPCATRPIADVCFDRLNGSFTWDQIDAALAACGAIDDQTPVCP